MDLSPSASEKLLFGGDYQYVVGFANQKVAVV